MRRLRVGVGRGKVGGVSTVGVASEGQAHVVEAIEASFGDEYVVP